MCPCSSKVNYLMSITLLIQFRVEYDEKSIGVFPIGETSQVIYNATDSSGNFATCTMNITLQGKKGSQIINIHGSICVN